MSKNLAIGEPAPWFHARALNGNSHYAFDTAAGRWTLMLFVGSGAHESSQAALELLAQNRQLFDDFLACFFGVTMDPSDAEQGRIAQQIPGIRWFLDYDGTVSVLYGIAQREGGTFKYAPQWLLLDPMQRIHSVASLANGCEIIAELRHRLGQTFEMPCAPVLVVPNILSPVLCRQLIALYEHHGGEESGFMRQENGKTVGRYDYTHKRRNDHNISDQRLIDELKLRVGLALRPMIRRAFQFDASRIERFIVACYEGAVGGHFGPHRDNTTSGTAHRRFACTINLNAEEYEGGDLAFPEFGNRTYRAPTGGAVVFSCSLLHQARPVTKGRRFAFLPFLYDDEGARLRERNLAHVSPELQNYRSGL